MIYRVKYYRDEDGWWIAQVLDVLGVHSNGLTLEDTRTRVREALSLMLGRDVTDEFKEEFYVT